MLREWGRDSSPNMPPPALCNLRLGAPNRGAVRWLRLFSLTEEMESRIYSQSAIVARVEGVRDRKTWWLFHLRLKGAPWNTSLTSELKRLFWAYKKSWAEIFIEPPRVTHIQIIVWCLVSFFSCLLEYHIYHWLHFSAILPAATLVNTKSDIFIFALNKENIFIRIF